MTTTDHRQTAAALVRAADRMLLDPTPGALRVQDATATGATVATGYATLALAHLGLAEAEDRIVFTPGAFTLPENADGESIADHLTRASLNAFAEKHGAATDPGRSAVHLRACAFTLPGLVGDTLAADVQAVLDNRDELELRLAEAENSLIGLAPAPSTTRTENSVAFLWPHVSDREVSTLGQRHSRLVMALNALAAEAGASRPRQRSLKPAEDAPVPTDRPVETGLPRKSINDRLTTAEQLVSILSGQHLVLDDVSWDALRAAQAAYGIRGVQ